MIISRKSLTSFLTLPSLLLYGSPLLLQLFDHPFLSSCRTTSKLVFLYKFIFSKLCIPVGSFSFQSQSSYNLCSSHPLNLNLRFFRKISTLQVSLSKIFLIYYRTISIAYILFIFIHSFIC